VPGSALKSCTRTWDCAHP